MESKLISEDYALSDVGLQRDLNEDRFLISQKQGVWAVADGMGGHEAGDLASQSIVEHLSSVGAAVSPPDLRSRVVDRLTKSNAHIQTMSQERNGAIMGSTVVVLLAFNRHYACVWSGDSRIYRVRNGAIEQLTRDHTEV